MTTESTRGRGIVKAIRDYGDYRRTIRELAFLSDRELSDLGIARGQIRAAARMGVGGR